MNMYSYYLSKGIDLDKLINLSFLEKQFYIASMQINKEDEVNKFNLFQKEGEIIWLEKDI